MDEKTYAPEQQDNMIDMVDPHQRIAELEQKIEDLVKQRDALQKTIIDWHSAMFGAVNLILKPHKYNLILEREYLLNLMPRRIDCMIFKKDKSIPIDVDAFRLFRRHNVVEFKSYLDDLNIDVIWTTISYAMQFMSQEEHIGDRSGEDISITIFRSAYPRALFNQLGKLGWKVEEKYHNVYYLTGFINLPIQVVVAKDLGEEYLPLLILTGNAKESDIRKFLEYREKLTDKSDIEFADAVVWASAEANKEIFEKLKEEDKMTGVLRDIMKDDFAKERREGAEQATTNNLYKYVSDGVMPVDYAAKERGISRDVFISNMRSAGYHLPQQPRA